ncbi:MAG: hypothetical protein M0R46_08935 [Candidatus Muirbacterium halophilum]|nr:hypothetical protein [Candidatus Muirbacterium halophilum]MCK9476030.1 hypothetical protein [Candidatus Muirbacterium halophilum]
MIIIKKKAFTIIEIAIVAALAFMIIGLILNTFFTNIKNVKTGEKINSLEFEKFMIFKEFSSTLKRFDYERIVEDDDLKITAKSKIFIKNAGGKKIQEISFIYFEDDEEHKITYRIDDKKFIREKDLVEKIVCENIEDSQFTFDGNCIGFKGNITGEGIGEDKEIVVSVETRFGIDTSLCEVIYEK